MCVHSSLKTVRKQADVRALDDVANNEVVVDVRALVLVVNVAEVEALTLARRLRVRLLVDARDMCGEVVLGDWRDEVVRQHDADEGLVKLYLVPPTLKSSGRRASPGRRGWSYTHAGGTFRLKRGHYG